MTRSLPRRTPHGAAKRAQAGVESLARRPMPVIPFGCPYVVMDHFSGRTDVPQDAWSLMTAGAGGGPYEYYGIHDPNDDAGFTADVDTGIIAWTGFGLYLVHAWTLYEGDSGSVAKVGIALNQAPAGTFRHSYVTDVDGVTTFTRPNVSTIIPYSTLAPTGADALGGFSYQSDSVRAEVYHDGADVASANFSYLRIAVILLGDASGTYTEP